MTGLGSYFYHLVYKLNSVPVVSTGKCQHPFQLIQHPILPVTLESGNLVRALPIRSNRNYKPNLQGPSSLIPEEQWWSLKRLEGYQIYYYWFPAGNFMERYPLQLYKEHLAHFQLFCLQVLKKKKKINQEG